jgi:hypothetical protein
MERARWWTSSSCGLPTRATAARALTRGGEDSDDGLCPHPSLAQGSGFYPKPWVGPG